MEPTTSRSERALQIVNRWIDVAFDQGLVPHKAVFWTARDILEGDIDIPPARVLRVITFITEKCRQSEDREILLAALKEVTL